MQQTVLIINMLLLFFIYFVFVHYIEKQRNEKNKILEQIKLLKIQQKQYQNLILNKNQELDNLSNQIDKTTQKISFLKRQQEKQQESLLFRKKELNDLLNQIKQLEEILKNKQNEIKNQYKILENQALEAFNKYFDTIDKNYEEKQKEYTIKINQIKKQQQMVQQQLVQIKNVYQAAIAAQLREQQNEKQLSFYKIKLTNEQIADILKIEEWKTKLNDSTIVSKIIWSTYILKPTSDLCNRVLGTNPVSGVYKITNKTSGEVYIGQSVNIAQRWKQHIKCGLGIDASSTNKLYNNMQNTGVWNFTFELLQKCSRDKLNEKERFWIEMYQSNKVGLNITRGNK